jgi:hypothetical protein
MDPVRELKVRAEILQKALASANQGALDRLRALPEMRRAAQPALVAMSATTRRKHCLAIVAREHGFSGWEHALRVLDGDSAEADFGTMLYGVASGGFLHPWFATYTETHVFADDALRSGGRPFLLAFGRQFFVAGSAFVASLGLDPQDADWRAIGWDWPRPRDGDARRRLYAKRITALRGPR